MSSSRERPAPGRDVWNQSPAVYRERTDLRSTTSRPIRSGVSRGLRSAAGLADRAIGEGASRLRESQTRFEVLGPELAARAILHLDGFREQTPGILPALRDAVARARDDLVGASQ